MRQKKTAPEAIEAELISRTKKEVEKVSQLLPDKPRGGILDIDEKALQDWEVTRKLRLEMILKLRKVLDFVEQKIDSDDPDQDRYIALLNQAGFHAFRIGTSIDNSVRAKWHDPTQNLTEDMAWIVRLTESPKEQNDRDRITATNESDSI